MAEPDNLSWCIEVWRIRVAESSGSMTPNDAQQALAKLGEPRSVAVIRCALSRPSRSAYSGLRARGEMLRQAEIDLSRVRLLLSVDKPQPRPWPDSMDDAICLAKKYAAEAARRMVWC